MKLMSALEQAEYVTKINAAIGDLLRCEDMLLTACEWTKTPEGMWISPVDGEIFSQRDAVDHMREVFVQIARS